MPLNIPPDNTTAFHLFTIHDMFTVQRLLVVDPEINILDSVLEFHWNGYCAVDAIC